MKITLVSYFYKPINNVGSQRWTALADYLGKAGHDIDVLSGPWEKNSENSKIKYLDDPFSSDARRLKEGGTNSAPATPKSRGLFPAFLLIDGKFLWGFNVVKDLFKSRHLKKNLVIVTGTPWSGVVATALCCHFLRIPYAIDFRDMWANESSLRLNTTLARKYFSWLEKYCVRHATLVFTVNETIRKYLHALNPTIPSLAITNGFSGALTWTTESFNAVADCKKQILYAGSVSNYHGVDHFFKSVRTELPLVFMGNDYLGILDGQKVIRLSEQSTQAAEKEMAQSAILLMTLDAAATNYTTGKLISYIKAGRPILLFGPKTSPAAQLILNHGIGWVVDTSEPQKLNEVLDDIRKHLDSKNPFTFAPKIAELGNYSIENCGARLNALLVNTRL